MKALKVTLLLSLVVFIPKGMNATSQDEVKADVEKALQWFPADTETILVANGFSIKHESSMEDFEEGPAPLLEFYQRFIALGAYTILGGESISFFANLRIRSLVEGARSFRAPHGLGLMSFEGATICFLESGQKDKMKAEFAGFAKNASSTLKLAGEEVLRFEEIFENDKWSFFLAWPEDDILIIATNEGYLSQTLANLKGPTSQGALPTDLIEWSYVDWKSAFWALRHYSLRGYEKDPSSPFKKDRKGNASDLGAVGFVVNVSESSDVQFHYLSSNLAAVKRIQTSVPGSVRSTGKEEDETSEATKLESKVEERPDGILALKRSFRADLDPDDRGSLDVEVLWFLGFGMYL